METFFGAGRGDSGSLTGSRRGIDKQLSGKCTLVGSGAKIDGVVLSIDITLSKNVLMLSGGGGMLSIIARLLGEESLMKSMSQELISFPGVSRSSRRYPFDLSVHYPSIQTLTAQECSFLSCTGFGTWAHPVDPKICKWDTSSFCPVQAS